MMKNKLVLALLVLGIVGGIALGFLVAFFLSSNRVATNTGQTENTNTVNTNLNANRATEVNTNSATETPTEPIEDEDVTWLNEPQEVDNLQLFKGSEGFNATYFTVATISDGGKIIFAKQTYDGPTQPAVMRFRQEADGTYALLTNYSNADDFFLDEVLESIKKDTATYAALDYPETLSVNGLDLKQNWPAFSYPALFTDLEDITQGTVSLFGTTAYGQMYVSVSDIQTDEENGSIKGKIYLLKLADSSTVIYRDEKPFLADDGTLLGNLQASGEKFTNRSFTSGLIADGCGYPNGDQYAASLNTSQLTRIGTTVAGENLYALIDEDGSLFKNAYTTYTVGRDPEGENPPISFAAFVAEQPVVVWQDSTGDYLIFTDSAFAALVECGKPVVYLYPTTPTTVSVKVGADISVSEPLYGTGWTVLAQPNGQITTSSGAVFPNLYWEGKGHGVYPKIIQGRVVSSTNIEQELRSDLAAQGLHQTEIQDFLNFWLPKMPSTPYIRLTWFNTPALNQLAPLTISPQPDTLLRVFLDFAGQNTPTTTLAPQTLRTTPRAGFTVVEWGGLLVGGK